MHLQLSDTSPAIDQANYFGLGFFWCLQADFIWNFIWSLLKKEISKKCQLPPLIPLCVWESVYRPDFASSWMVWAENGPKKGLRGLNRMGVHPIVCPTRAPVWQTSVSSPASLTKFQGVPCQEVGGVGAAVHIWLHCVPSQSATETTAWEAHEEWALKGTKGSGGSDGLCQNPSFTPRSYLPIQPKWTLQYFASRINRSLVVVLLSSISMSCIKPGSLSRASAAGVTPVTGRRGYQGLSFPNQPLPSLLTLFKALSWQNFSLLLLPNIFLGWILSSGTFLTGGSGQICTNKFSHLIQMGEKPKLK